ncbi:MAG: c-type cytochrome biogenesis protein CcmI, partial [Paracoccaceae bacterium]
GFDLKVYRDQLREIDRDAARNLVPAEEAERLRTEIARRILAADTKAQAGGTDLVQTPQRGIGHKIAAVVLAAGTVGGAFALYMQMGAPRYGDLPLASRIAMAQEALDSRPSQAQVEARIPATAPADVPADYLELVAQLRGTVGERPNDLQGHVYLARTEAALGNYIAAYTAQKRVIALKGARVTAEDHAILADLHILAAGGYVSPEADAALRAALQIDPSQGLARYYVGQLMAQNGRPDVAFQMWRNVLNESAPTDPWVPAIREQIEELALLAGDVNYRLPPAAPLAAP